MAPKCAYLLSGKRCGHPEALVGTPCGQFKDCPYPAVVKVGKWVVSSPKKGSKTDRELKKSIRLHKAGKLKLVDL